MSTIVRAVDAYACAIHSPSFETISNGHSSNRPTIGKSRSFIDMLLNGIYALPEIEKLIDIFAALRRRSPRFALRPTQINQR